MAHVQRRYSMCEAERIAIANNAWGVTRTFFVMSGGRGGVCFPTR
jgi:hypothetical protein